LGLAERADREGWRLVVLDVQLDTASPTGRLVLTMMAGVAEFERRRIGERTRDALAVRKAQGVRLGRPVMLPADVRDRIATRRAAGAPLATIAAELRADGVATAQGVAPGGPRPSPPYSARSRLTAWCRESS
jgi:DNA invertase Pin-like site-specific DNA recombinase